MLSPVSTAALPDDDLTPLVDLLAGRRVVALTGAGCSTESGIPDYRGGGRTGPRNPIQHDAFMKKPDVRRRYWARATLGWARFSGAEPNAAHRALAALEAAGHVAGVITQNVDRLHHGAGSRRVVELHGALADVACLRCGHGEPRHELQADASTTTIANVPHDNFMTRMEPRHDRTPSVAASRDRTAPTGADTFTVAMSSARVGPMLTTAIGTVCSCARRTKRKPE